MPNVNIVVLAGNLTRDPEIRYTPSGTAVANVDMAINRRWFNKQSGQNEEEVTFVSVTVWGKQAEAVAQYLHKGRPILIEGRLKLDQWEDRETGQKRSRLKVVCDRWQFMDSKQDGGGQGQAPQSPAPQHHQGRSAPPPQRANERSEPPAEGYGNPPPPATSRQAAPPQRRAPLPPQRPPAPPPPEDDQTDIPEDDIPF